MTMPFVSFSCIFHPESQKPGKHAKNFLTCLDIRLCPHASAGFTGCSATSSCVALSGTCQLPNVFYWRHFLWFHAIRISQSKKHNTRLARCFIMFLSFSVMYCTIKFRLSQSLPGLPVLLITTDKYLRQSRFPDLGGSISGWLRWQERALQIKKQDAKSCKSITASLAATVELKRWVRMNIHWLPSDCPTASAAAVSSANGSSRLRSSAAGTSCHHVETNTIAWNSCTCWPLRQTHF